MSWSWKITFSNYSLQPNEIHGRTLLDDDSIQTPFIKIEPDTHEQTAQLKLVHEERRPIDDRLPSHKSGPNLPDEEGDHRREIIDDHANWTVIQHLHELCLRVVDFAKVC